MLSSEIAFLILRIVIGLLFVGHGAQKLFGWFGGSGLDGTAEFYAGLDVAPPKLWAGVAGLAEFLGGLGLALGFLLPIAAAAIMGVMLMAIIKVHWQNGMWVSEGGMEYALLNAVLVAVIGLVAPGQYALDTVMGISYPMPMTFVVALIVVVAGLIAALISGSAMGEPTAETQH